MSSMRSIVCIVCDAPKPPGELPDDHGHCNRCGKPTVNRRVASDQEPIAPTSTITFERQRELFQQEAV